MNKNLQDLLVVGSLVMSAVSMYCNISNHYHKQDPFLAEIVLTQGSNHQKYVRTTTPPKIDLEQKIATVQYQLASK